MQKYFLFLFLVFCKIAAAQVVLPSLVEIGGLKAVSIELQKKKASAKSSFSSFAIKDRRKDTLTNGYVRFTSEYKKYNRLEFEKGPSSAAVFLNTYFNTDSANDSFRLVVLLKNFFLTQEYRSGSSLSLSSVIYISKASVAASLLLQKGEKYFRLGEVDTVITVQKWLGRSYNTLAQNALLHLAEKGEALLQTLTSVEIALDEKINGLQSSAFVFDSPKEGFYQTYADFLAQQNTPVAFRFEQHKKTRIVKPVSEVDTSLIKTNWGFVEKGTLYVREGVFYIPMQANFGSFSGLGITITEVDKVPLTGFLLQNPFIVAADMADLAINGPVAKMEYYRLFKLNLATGALE